MSKLILGLTCGVLFGLMSAGLMLPMKFTDKTSALLGAFINRFSIGFIIGAIVLPLPYWLIGLLYRPAAERPRCPHYQGLCTDYRDGGSRWAPDRFPRRSFRFLTHLDPTLENRGRDGKTSAYRGPSFRGAATPC
jgi:hypothetical protein